MDVERAAPGSSDFGRLLRDFRLAAGLSQEALAERARMSVNGISALERGERQYPQRATVALLVGALELSPERRSALETAAKRPVQLRADRTGVVVPFFAGPAASNLPSALTTFIGRERELSQIIALMHERRLVTLIGTGGVGKTRASIAAGAEFQKSRSDANVWFVELAPISDPGLVTAAIASAAGATETPNRPLLDVLQDHLARRATLLIVDNCEHVVDEAARVVDALLRACPDLRVLATSREALRVVGENAYRLPSFDVPTASRTAAITASEAARYEAVTLFVERAVAADQRFALTDQNAGHVAAICRRLDGIPLAVELAAARIATLPLPVLARQLEHRLDILAGGPRTVQPRQQTMRGAIDWSYDLLGEQERIAFESLSIFAGGCTLETATWVCADAGLAENAVLGLLSSLTERSLLVVDTAATEPRYRMLEVMRQYGREKLVAAGRDRAVALSHLRGFVDLAENWRSFDLPDQQTNAAAGPELDNVRAALEWSLGERNAIDLGLELVARSQTVWYTFARNEGLRWVLSARELASSDASPLIMARLDEALATLSEGSEEVLTAVLRAADTFRRFGERAHLVTTLASAAMLLAYYQRWDEADACLAEARDLAPVVNKPRLSGWVLQSVGYRRSCAGDYSAAREAYAQALALYREAGADRLAAVARRFLAETVLWSGDAEGALRIIEKVRDEFQRLGNRVGISEALRVRANCLVALERFDDVPAAAREMFAIGRELGLQWIVLEALTMVATTGALRMCSDEERARESRERSALLLGFLTACVGPGNPREAADHERLSNALIEALGFAKTEALMTAGATLTQDEAIEEALLV